MRLDGIHHVTAITADARGNVDFYARVLGLRMVKKTVNFDAPEMYDVAVERAGDALVFADPEGLGLEIQVGEAGATRRAAEGSDLPPEHALGGLLGVHAYSARRASTERVLADRLGFEAGRDGAHTSAGAERRARYFRSIYFHEPGGVLFEIASLGPGFAIDEAPERLGEALRLPPQFARYRNELEELLAPLRNPRAERVS